MGMLDELEAAAGPLERAKILGRIWNHAYRNGYAVAYERFVTRRGKVAA
jgi:hypothetical protein